MPAALQERERERESEREKMGHHSCCNKQKVKRGLWSPEEDEKLINYISAYGHGCWSSVPRLAGLQRCGKSCRLRWINYLRPDLKRGSFSPQESALIIELHRILGNRWAQIAKHLPGRTDNEVKNFWNSSIKKKLMSAGVSDLPSFPDISNPSGSHEGFLSLNPNPNFISNPQQDQINYLPTPILNHQTNFIDVQPEVQLESNHSFSHGRHPWSIGHQYDHQNENHMVIDGIEEALLYQKSMAPFYDDGPSMAHIMPKLCEIIGGNELSASCDPIARLSCFSSGSNPHDLHVPANQMEYIDVIMSTLPPSSSSSSLSGGEFIMNPNDASI